MKTTFRMERDRLDEVIRFSGQIAVSDVERLKLDFLDRSLLNQENNPANPLWSANNLLVLEMLFRRLAEQYPDQKETPDLSGRG